MTRCTVPSSMTGLPCLLEEGHAPWRPDRFHRYGPDQATEEATARLVHLVRQTAEIRSRISPETITTARVLDALYRMVARLDLADLFGLAEGRMRPAVALTEHERHRLGGEWVASCPSCLEGLAHSDHYALSRGRPMVEPAIARSALSAVEEQTAEVSWSATGAPHLDPATPPTWPDNWRRTIHLCHEGEEVWVQDHDGCRGTIRPEDRATALALSRRRSEGLAR